MKKILSKIKKEQFKRTLLLEKSINLSKYDKKYFTCSDCETRLLVEKAKNLIRYNLCPVCKKHLMTKSNLDKINKVKENLESLTEELKVAKQNLIKEDKRLNQVKNEIKSNRTISVYSVGEWSPCQNSYNDDGMFELSFRSSKYATHESYAHEDDYEGDRDELTEVIEKIVKNHFKNEYTCSVDYGEKEWFQLTLYRRK